MQNYFVKFDQTWHYRPVLILSALCLGCFLIWSAFTTIDEHVRASGRIIPSGKVRVIQHLEGGIISQIEVSEGEEIKADDILFYIKNQKAESDLQELQIALQSKEIKKIRLEAELSEEKDPQYTTIQQEQFPEIVASEQQLFAARKAEFEESILGIEKRMQQKVFKLDDLSTTIENLTKELSVAKEQLSIKLELRKKEAVSRSQYLDVVSKVRDFETRIAKSEKEIPVIKTEISELANRVKEMRQKRFSDVGEELNEVKVEIRKLNERISALNDEVSRTAIRSPVDGIVNKIYINTIGGVVQPGGKLAEIIPLNEQLIVEAKITTNDRGKIWPGQPVVAQITAYDYTLYGGIKGELNYVSANSFIDNQNNEFYQVRATLEKTNLGEDRPVYPGMTAQVSILAGKVSILHAILKPIWNIRDNALREK